MKRRTKRLTVASVLSTAVVALAATAGVQFAGADPAPEQQRYYVQIGGTGASQPDPECTSTYRAANEQLDDGVVVPVCYPASVGPFVGSDNAMPAPGAPSYDDSVGQGFENLLGAVSHTHHNDPSAHIVVVGFSQGADVANRVLEAIAYGETDVPAEAVSGKLYADPRQPGTGIWSHFPEGTSLLGLTSPGDGPVDFPGMNVERHCIHTDGICDATSLDSFPGYFTQHPLYPQAGGIIESTMTEPTQDGVFWH